MKMTDDKGQATSDSARSRDRHPSSVTGHPPRIRAFTIIELLVAVAILGTIVTAIYASWTAVLRAAKAGNTAADEVQRIRIARQALEQSLASAVLYAGNPRYYSFLSDTTDEKFAFLSFVAHLPDDFPGSGMFPNQPLRRVTFAVQPGTNSGPPSLILRQASLLTPTNSPIEESYTLTLTRNLAVFGVEFWSTNIGDWDVEWLQTNQLPKMVRVTLGMGGAQAGSPPSVLVSSVISPGGQGVNRELQGVLRPLGGVGLQNPPANPIRR
ncbi:MAG: prepilin-type N-terminal cleavage/methylation domain-containing protein [Verrucomicrobia bacterium]|nr:prepilin-type N-terminal cleavage/methylation domain-containing protein [Verrucomicrobiota bacterium]NBU08536.1 prepilin-type N-terminal cleavage/methylation domain-containing protein [Pseudomonadota bacterium]NDA66939.1 prepilin-type N-terminal cleavage/methylation domain-containing protein [Verrucomicrobiota bacterium]NDB74162.1 prepilin-type N-terminal cleavage/methylation domain-containing protein [Verrucomicrobiota bacterium]NDD38646.1 prepilin-type N-terminal cleavage/methylation domai